MALIRLQEAPATVGGRFLSNGFRPLFLLCGLQALYVMSAWLLQLAGVGLPLPVGWSGVEWHGHELLFGFVGAAIGGFLLAAVAKWTGRLPVCGWPLLALVLCWLAGRVASSGVLALPPVLMLIANGAYWLLLVLLVGREIVLAGNRRNAVVVLALLAMSGFNLLFQLGWVERLHLLESQVLLIVLLISLIGGRITPAFTRNWLIRRLGPQAVKEKKVALPATFGWVDRLAVGTTLLATLAWVFWPLRLESGALLLVAGSLQLLRLARWRGWSSVPEPLLFALHLGYLWVGIGLLLLGASVFSDAITRTAAIHALAVGAMGGMILAVAARAALGHTLRELNAGPLMTVAFIALHLAALVRVGAALWPGWGYPLLMLAGSLWLLAFALFALRYVPILLGPEISLSEALQRGR